LGKTAPSGPSGPGELEGAARKRRDLAPQLDQLDAQDDGRDGKCPEQDTYEDRYGPPHVATPPTIARAAISAASASASALSRAY
jgi:hypothetical protein